MIFIRIFGDQAKSGTFGICATDPAAPITGFTGPGGVGDSLTNELWLRADKGPEKDDGSPALNGENIRIWKDQSGNGQEPSQVSGPSQAVLMTGSISGMPAIHFDGVNDNYTLEPGTLASPLSIFAVSRFNNIVKDQTAITIGDANVNNSASLSRETDNRYYSLTGVKNYGPVINPAVASVYEINHRIVAPYHVLKVDGLNQTVADYAIPLTTDGSLHIGSSGTMTGFFDGDLAEIIIYTKNVNSAQEIIINNYLAAKYGIGIGAADRYGYETTHKYDVAGIGRVDDQNIHSRAQSDSILTIGGASDLENDEFLLFGHDSADITSWTSAETPSGDPHIKRIMREWRIDESGGDGVGTVTLGLNPDRLPAMPAGFLAYNLLVDADGDFASGASAYGLVRSGTEYLANNIDLPDGSYITVAAVNPVVQFDTTASEGGEAVDHPAFKVSLNYAVSDPFQLNYSVTGGTATGGGVDYSLNPGVISFIPGQKGTEIIPLIINDTIVEIPDENFHIALASPTNGIILGADSLHTYTILDDDMDISISASDTVTGICRSSMAQLIAVATGQGPFTYAWAPADSLSDPANDTVNAYPSVSTLYTVTVTDYQGYSEQKSIMIHVSGAPSKPIVTPSGTADLCDGDSITLTSDSAFSYIWSTGETTRSISVKTSGNYSVGTLDNHGCLSPVSDEVQIQVITVPEPLITAITDTTVCDGDTVKLQGPPASSWLWSTGESTQEIRVTNTEIIDLKVQDAGGCFSLSSAPVHVTVNPLPAKPVITPAGPIAFCEGDSIELATSTPASSFAWSDGSDAQSIKVYGSGKYTVIITDAEGCVSPVSDTAVVTANPMPARPSIVASGAASFCEGNDVILTASASGGYLWQDGATTQRITVSQSGSYFVRVSEDGCISDTSETVNVEVYPVPEPPEISPSPEVEIITGDSILLIATDADGYLWSTGDSTKQIYAAENGSYSVQAVSTQGCMSEPSVATTLTVNNKLPKPSITTNGSTVLCEGQSVQLSAETAASYLWSNGATTQTIEVNEGGSYSLVIVNGAGIQSLESDPVVVTVAPNPEPVIQATNVNCFGGSDGTVMVSVNGGLAPFTFSWMSGETGQSLSGLSSGEYSVNVTDARFCLGTAMVTIEQPSQLQVQGSVTNASCPESSDGSVIATVNGGVTPYTWTWNSETSADGNREGLPSGTYDVGVTDANNCSMMKEFTVDYDNETCFRIPGIITPNGDGKNDTWQIDGLGLYPDAVVQVYDRWGKRVFYSRGYDTEWDGTFNGKELPMESYHYIIDLHNGMKPEIGNITIVR